MTNSNQLKVALAQIAPVWLNKAATIEKIEHSIKEAASEKAEVEIVGYVRMAVGEGIEKKEEDFAAEVAKAAKG